MTEVAFRVEMLPASLGDAILVTVPANEKGPEWRMLVDTGPTHVKPQLTERLRRLHLQEGGSRIDLLVITHLDTDHIGNAVALLELLKPQRVWFNGQDQVEWARTQKLGTEDDLDVARGPRQADAFSQALGDAKITPNGGLPNGVAAVPQGLPYHRVAPLGGNAPDFVLLGPYLAELTKLSREWDTVRSAADDGNESPQEPGAGQESLPPICLADLPRLANGRFTDEKKAANRSSVVLFLTHRGRSILLTGDGHVEQGYGTALAKYFADHRNGPHRIDLLKVSHHGSRTNTSRDVALFRARHYLIPTDSSKYGHPDDETLARLIHHRRPNAAPAFWFTKRTPVTRRWADVAAATDNFFTVHYPPGDTEGFALDVMVDGEVVATNLAMGWP